MFHEILKLTIFMELRSAAVGILILGNIFMKSDCRGVRGRPGCVGGFGGVKESVGVDFQVDGLSFDGSLGFDRFGEWRHKEVAW